MKRAGKEDIMKDMEHQKMMLANRHISGKYKWSDGTEVTYTGTYERKFLECLDKILHWPSEIYVLRHLRFSLIVILMVLSIVIFLIFILQV